MRRPENPITNTRSSFKVGDLVFFTEPMYSGSFGVVAEIYPCWRDTHGSKKISQLRHHVRYYRDGRPMQCPDFARCQHSHACPIHGRNVWEEELKAFTSGDITFYAAEGLIQGYLSDQVAQSGCSPS